ncbi:hypothetical protein ACIRD3_23745 [Kitasatospora sp. NPDC093550]|uniref:hypothetical protein n=1 Tax=Kitasatospora sp. NPDC093550 TaxID=3364089 RepID=UPI00380A01F3
MSTTTDALVTATLIAPGAILTAAALITQHRGKADSAAVNQVLAASAAERAARAATTDTAPPDGGEGAPAPAVTAPAARLATVLPFTGAGARRAA